MCVVGTHRGGARGVESVCLWKSAMAWRRRAVSLIKGCRSDRQQAATLQVPKPTGEANVEGGPRPKACLSPVLAHGCRRLPDPRCPHGHARGAARGVDGGERGW